MNQKETIGKPIVCHSQFEIFSEPAFNFRTVYTAFLHFFRKSCKFIILVIVFAATYTVNAQTRSEKYWVQDTRVHVGKVVQNWLTDSFPQRDAAVLYELRISKQNLGEKSWHKSFGYPQIGASLIYGDLGNKSQFGYCYGIVPNITFNPLVYKRWRVKLTLGMGFAYFDHPYDSILNPHNLLIGSKITNLSFASLYFHRQINDKLDINFGISAFHASNGHYQIPNVGLNAPTIDLGIKYYPKGRPNFHYKDTTATGTQNIRLNVKFGIGVHEFAETTKPIGGPKYNIYTGMVYLSKIMGAFSKVQIGASGRYYSSYYNFYKTDSIFTEQLHLRSSVFSVFLGHEFLMGHFSFLAQGALDLYFPQYKPYNEKYAKKHGFFYYAERLVSTRLGMQYYLFSPKYRNKRNLFVGIYINANFGEADFIESGIGYTF